ncbi:cytochrome P450 [Myceligenerans indicum]|uniref:Cytochrome P450 n=1 Tax=Myceligenerans indicum TaxID=2593663 RepID=A0ABS1LKC5_9MICO|nr:cytochrome P450 [Myceligenerans indicum]MBL0886666.1 cytochrome P450 [Myceligenerans indicum]
MQPRRLNVGPDRTRLEDVAYRPVLLGEHDALDPYTDYERLREKWGALAPVDMVPGVPAWLVLGYEEAASMLRSEIMFSRDPRNWAYVQRRALPPGLLAVMAPRESAYHVDGPRHRRLRAPIDDAFAAIDETRLRVSVEVACDAILDGLAGRGEADLIQDFTVPLCVYLLGELLGLSHSDAQRMSLLTRDIFGARDTATAASEESMQIMMEHVAAHRPEPGDDLTTAMLEHSAMDNDVEVMTTLAEMFVLAHDAQVAWVAGALHLLLTDERFAARLYGGRLDVTDAVDEASRTRPPVVNVLPRFARQDCELGGRYVAAGDALIPAIVSANADPALSIDDPLSDAGGRYHLTWGVGPHSCPAQRVASIIGRTAIAAVVHRIPQMRLAADPGEIRMVRSLWTRYPAALPVRFVEPVQASRW